MAKTTKRRFTDEFKREAVALWEKSGRPQTEVASELGIMPTMLRRWQRKLQECGPPASPAAKPPVSPMTSPSDQASEIAKLRRELDRARMERDILKKGVIILDVPRGEAYPKRMSSALSSPHFHDEEAAYAFVEARIWPEGPVCPHCGGVERISKMQGKSTRLGAYKCYQCRKPFTVKIGTIFEDSKVAMHIWMQAMYLVAGSKKGISSNQLHRTLGITLKTAWFMSHRIREAMRSGDLTPFGSGGGIVEVDETFIGHDRSIKPEGVKRGRGYAHKHKVLSLIDRDTGRQRSMVVDSLKAADLTPILVANIAAEAIVMTDEASQYRALGAVFAGHGFTRHGAGQYVDYENPTIHTNTIEGAFSIFKRGMKGVYQHCAKKHLHRYVAEFEFRYTNRIATGFNDTDRADAMILGTVGKRLTYVQSCTRA